jgi:hypothetical protein
MGLENESSKKEVCEAKECSLMSAKRAMTEVHFIERRSLQCPVLPSFLLFLGKCFELVTILEIYYKSIYIYIYIYIFPVSRANCKKVKV